MNRSWMEPAYAAARAWALQPISRPPAGWAQIVRRGIANLAVQGQTLAPITLAPEPTYLPRSADSGLLTVLTAMIAEVCQ
jgi:hypothetical protein